MGLLAIIVQMKNDVENLTVDVLGSPVLVGPLINLTILAWSSYACLMVLAYSPEGGENSRLKKVAELLLLGPYLIVAMIVIVAVLSSPYPLPFLPGEISIRIAAATVAVLLTIGYMVYAFLATLVFCFRIALRMWQWLSIERVVLSRMGSKQYLAIRVSNARKNATRFLKRLWRGIKPRTRIAKRRRD